MDTATTSSPNPSDSVFDLAALESYLTSKGSGPGTFRTFRSQLRAFSRLPASQPELDAEIVRWTRTGATPATVNVRLNALAAYLKALERRRVPHPLRSGDIRRVKQPATPYEVATLEDLQALRRAAAELPDPAIAARDVAALDCLYATGCRAGELGRLEVRLDGNFAPPERATVVGKGRKPRLVFLDLVARQSLARWALHDAARPVAPGAPYRPFRFSVRQLQRLLARLSDRAGLAKPVGPHALRHLLATTLLQRGADIRAVQALLGHASVTTTQRYAHVTDRHLEAAYQSAIAR